MHAAALAAILLALILPLGTPSAFAQPDPAPGAASGTAPDPGQRYAVVGVAAGDTLNMRAAPDASAEVVDALQPDATALVVSGARVEQAGSAWWQVVRPDGALAWVNARYLAVVDADAPREHAYPLHCTGTEPFWSVRTVGKEARFQTPDAQEAWSAGPMTPAAGQLGRYAIRLEGRAGDVGHLSLWRNPAFCSDGMSDTGFPFEAILATPGGQVLSGCCMRAGQ